MAAENSDDLGDLLDGFGTGERSDATPSRSPEQVLEMARSKDGFQRAFILTYMALSMPLVVGVAGAIFSSLTPSLPSLISIVIINAPALVWFASMDASKNYVPPRMDEFNTSNEVAARSRLRDIRWGSTIGMVVTWILANVLITYAHFPGSLAPGHVISGLIIAVVVTGVLSFFVPAVSGFNALVRVFRASEESLTSGGIR